MSEAGEYELIAESWERILSKPGEPLDFERFRKGDTVTLNVEEATRLESAGAVAKPGELKRRQIEQLRIQLAAAQAQLPPDPDADADGDAPDGVGVSTGTEGAGSGEVPQPPAKSAGKADWVTYATHPGHGERAMTAEDADKATPAQIAARFKG